MLIKLINRYIRPYLGYVAGVAALQLVAVCASLLLPTMNGQIIDQGVARADTDYIVHRGAQMLAVAGAQVLAQCAAVFLAANAAMKFGRDVRSALFNHALEFSAREINDLGTASLITRNTNDVLQVQTLVFMTCSLMISAPLTMAGGVFMALRQDVVLSWTILIAVAALAISVSVIVLRMTPLFQRQQFAVDEINRVTREQITGIRVVRAFTQEEQEQARFTHANDRLMKLGLSIGALFSLLFPLVMLILDVSQVGVMWLGGSRIDEGEMEVGKLIAFLTYLMQILMSVMMATMMVLMAPRAAVCAKRIMEVFKTDSSVTWRTDPVTSNSPGEEILRLDNVEFCYPGASQPVLENISFAIKRGQTTAIIGSTGAGKSTLVNLIPRLFNATDGRVLVDGVDVVNYDPNKLWAKIGLVPQKAYLFSGTVASNLKVGKPDASEDEMRAALKVAQADFVEQLGSGEESGLNAKISQGGTNVSGGQRQRLAIARALIKKPDLYIFDDAFSALDASTEARLRSQLSHATTDAGVLIVAQRVSSISHADQIVVLENGRIDGIGTHEELLNSCRTYREIVESQEQVSA